jgi:hypothetical protein
MCAKYDRTRKPRLIPLGRGFSFAMRMVASWFETREDALLTMRVLDLMVRK